jgi:hypothetical protein
MSFCMGFTVPQLCCRAYHVGMAAGAGADPHCGHAIGQGACQ